MGLIIYGVCKVCGYGVSDLSFGGGFRDQMACCNYPGIDKLRRKVVIKNIVERRKVKKKFPDFIFYDDKTLCDKSFQKKEKSDSWDKYKIYQDGYLCPKCGQFRFGFFPIGGWD